MELKPGLAGRSRLEVSVPDLSPVRLYPEAPPAIEAESVSASYRVRLDSEDLLTDLRRLISRDRLRNGSCPRCATSASQSLRVRCWRW